MSFLKPMDFDPRVATEIKVKRKKLYLKCKYCNKDIKPDNDFFDERFLVARCKCLKENIAITLLPKRDIPKEFRKEYE